MNLILTVFCVCLVIKSIEASGVEELHALWSYPSDDKWPDRCFGKKQSPINIIENDASRDFSDIVLINYDKKVTGTILNDGHTVAITIDPQHELYVIGGGLRGKYLLKQLHFHWKSEHTINGKRYPLEGHFVHIEEDSHNQRVKRSSSINEHDDIQVLAVFYKISLEDNMDILNVIEAVQSVQTVGSTKNVEFVPRSLLPENMAHYYRYEGSLTTPPCYEIVHWTIFPFMVPLSLEQYEEIIKVDSFNGKYTSNYKSIMPLNDRVVKLYNTSNLMKPNHLIVLLTNILLITFLIKKCNSTF